MSTRVFAVNELDVLPVFSAVVRKFLRGFDDRIRHHDPINILKLATPYFQGSECPHDMQQRMNKGFASRSHHETTANDP